jgi:hypothetical protein
MAAVVYYYGWESLCEWGVEDDTAGANYGTAVTPTEGFAYLRSATITVDENVTREFNIGGGTMRKPDSTVKGPCDISGTLNFWIANDLDATTIDCWILKLPFDAYNVAHSGTAWVIPNTGTSIYGSNELLAFSLEIGHNKTGSIRVHKIEGCVANRFSIKAAKGEKVSCTLDFYAETGTFDNTSFTAGTVTRSTARPFLWSDCIIQYADDNTQTTVTDITAIELIVENNIVKNLDVGADATRAPSTMIMGPQMLSGTFTINLTTTAGVALYDALTNDASAPYTPALTCKMKEIGLIMQDATNPTTQKIAFRFRNVTIGKIPMDINPEKHTEVTVPFTAQYYTLTLTTPDATSITNWSATS